MATVKLDPAKGVQIPNLTTTERNAISSPETGALIWNTTTSAINQYNGSAWEATDTNTQADITGKLNLSGGTMTGDVTSTSNIKADSFTVGAASASGEALYIVDGGHTGHGASNTVSLVSIAENVSGNSAGVWLGSMTNENTAVIGSRTATGNIAFQTYNGGWGERMRISYAGIVTMPSQPIFWSRRTSSGSSGIQTGFSASVNIGNHFNGQKFTAPVTGVYEFYWQSIGPTGTSVVDTYVYKNGTSNSTILSARPDETGGTHASLSSAIGIASLSANDYIEIYTTGAVYSDSNSWHKFGGRLIG